MINLDNVLKSIDDLKFRTLALLFSAIVLPLPAPGQDFNLTFETRANGTITGLEVLNTPEGDLVVATSVQHIYWFDPISSTWSEQLLPSFGRPNGIQQVGDSTIVVSANVAGLHVLSSDRTVFTADFVEPPHWQWHSFTVAGSGRWISGGDLGTSWSDNDGETWSPIDTLFVDSCCTRTAFVRSLRGGITVAWAMTGTAEPNFPRLHYSTDEGSTWSDSAEVAFRLLRSDIHDFLSTPQHVEVQISRVRHLARRSWADPLVEFTSNFVAEDATWSNMFGIIAASNHGLFVLDESSMTWSPTGGPPMAIWKVAASESGSLYFAQAGTRDIWRLDPVSTNTEAPEHAVLPKLTVYPNPSSDIIYLAGSRQTREYILYDVLGRVIREVDGAEFASGINISDMAPGVYYLVEHSSRTGDHNTAAFIAKTGR